MSSLLDKFGAILLATLILLSMGACGANLKASGDAYVHHVIEIDLTKLEEFITRMCSGESTQASRAKCEADEYNRFVDMIAKSNAKTSDSGK